MVGGGCRGLRLARDLVADGHAVRAVTRSEERRAEIEAAGCECWIGDPDRIGTLRYALDNVTVLLWLLGTATGPNTADLHGSRLRMMLEKVTDTTVRGVVYEAAGTVGAATLRAGAAELARARELNEIPGALLAADPGAPEQWVGAARAAIERLLSVDRATP
jgi:NAD(P)H-binding